MATSFNEAVVTAAVTFAGIVLLLVAGGIEPSGTQVGVLLAAFLALGFVARKTIEQSVGFTLISLGLALVVIEYVVPDVFLEPFGALTDLVRAGTGVDLPSIDPVEFLIVAVVFTAVMLAIRERFYGRRSTPQGIADYVASRFATYLRAYTGVGRTIVVFLFGIGVFVFMEMGAAIGDVGSLVSEAPIVASNLLAVVAGYIGLGGEVPWLGEIPILSDITAAGFLLVGLFLLGVAAASKYEGSGPLAQFLKRQ